MAEAIERTRDGFYKKAKEIAESLDTLEAKDARTILSIARSLL